MEMIILPTLSHFFQTLIDSRGIFLEGMLLTFTTNCDQHLHRYVHWALLCFTENIPRRDFRIYRQCLYLPCTRNTTDCANLYPIFWTHGINIPDFWAASIALAFHNGAYIAEIFRGAIQSIDQGQKEAGRSLGMGRFLTMRRIILPQAMRRALPPLGNQFIIGLKDSSLAAFISVNELFNVATTQGSNSFDNMTYLLVVAVYYLVLVLLLTFAVQTFEKKLSVSDH